MNMEKLLHDEKYSILNGKENNYSVPYKNSMSYIEIIPKKKHKKSKTIISNYVFEIPKYSYRGIIASYNKLAVQNNKLAVQNNKLAVQYNKLAVKLADKCNKKKRFEILMEKLYDDVGISIEELLIRLNLDTNVPTNNDYEIILDKLNSQNGNNKLFLLYKKLLFNCINVIKLNENNIDNLKIEYKQLEELYNILKSKEPKIIEYYQISASAEIDIVAGIKPEISEYIRRGYSLTDSTGKFIPIDQDILNQIKIDLQIS